MQHWGSSSALGALSLFKSAIEKTTGLFLRLLFTAICFIKGHKKGYELSSLERSIKKRHENSMTSWQ